MQIECYAQRLLNPFRGVTHTIRYESAEAVTTDGIEWDIYVANDALLDGLGRAGKRALISDIRYGHWSAEKGLKRGPLYPSDDFMRLEHMGAVVYEHLLKVHREVPFNFRDSFELWLLDRNDQPLALLHSVRADSETDTRPPLDWRAGIAAQEQFKSTAIAGLAESAGGYLTRYVNGLASGVAQWFRRSDDGDEEAAQAGPDEIRNAPDRLVHPVCPLELKSRGPCRLGKHRFAGSDPGRVEEGADHGKRGKESKAEPDEPAENRDRGDADE